MFLTRRRHARGRRKGGVAALRAIALLAGAIAIPSFAGLELEPVAKPPPTRATPGKSATVVTVIPPRPPPTPAPSGQEGRTVYLSEKVSLRLVRLPSGIWAGCTEVTQVQYEALMGANPSRFKDPSRPVESVTWGEAADFCRRLTEWERQHGSLPEGCAYRLPTEKEWILLASDVAPQEAVSSVNRRLDKTEPCGGCKPNALGVSDALGNVWEWCQDGYDSVHRWKVVKGGAWSSDNPADLSIEARKSADPAHRNEIIGFRVVLAPGK